MNSLGDFTVFLGVKNNKLSEFLSLYVHILETKVKLYCIPPHHQNQRRERVKGLSCYSLCLNIVDISSSEPSETNILS